MKQPPRFTPLDEIYSAEPRFDELPAAAARRKRQRLQRAVVFTLLIVVLALGIGLYSVSKLGEASDRIRGEIDATMTVWARNYNATNAVK